jgi:hypothetical protein
VRLHRGADPGRGGVSFTFFTLSFSLFAVAWFLDAVAYGLAGWLASVDCLICHCVLHLGCMLGGYADQLACFALFYFPDLLVCFG